MKPISCDIQFKYKCPKCQSEYWLTQQEVKTKGFKIACCHTITIDMVKKIHISVDYLSQDEIDSIVQDSYNALKTLGYSLKQVKSFQEIINADSAQELTAKFLKIQ